MKASRSRKANQTPEALPEIDRLDGFPHPRHTRQLFGQQAGEDEIAARFSSGQMHHGWLISGPEGVGKATLAYWIARYVLAEPEERGGAALLGAPSLDVRDDGRTAIQVRSLSHPGLCVIRRRWDASGGRFPAQITVDDVRRLRAFLTRTADGDSWRVVIVDRADELNVNAANALLKGLEEPPVRCLFLLVTSAPGRMLPTIQSRCRRLVLPALEDADLRRACDQAISIGRATDGGVPGTATPGDPIDEMAWGQLAHLAAGSPRRALQLHADGGLALHSELSNLLSGLPRIDRVRLGRFVDQLTPANAETNYAMAYDLLFDSLARAVRLRAQSPSEATESAPENEPADALVAALAKPLTSPEKVARFAGLWDILAREKADAEAINLDRRTQLLDAFLRLERATG